MVLCEWNPLVPSEFPSERVSNAESIFMWSCCQHDLRFLGIILSPRSGYYVLRLVAMITSLSLVTNCLVNNRALFQYQGCLSGIGIPIIKMRWFWYVELVHYKDEMVMIHWVYTGHIFKGSHWDPLNIPCQPFISTSDESLSIRSLETNFSKRWIKVHLKMVSTKWQPFYTGLNVLAFLVLIPECSERTMSIP